MSLVRNEFVGNRTGLSDETIAQLREEISGVVITPDDFDYENVRIGLSREVVRHPALIVRAVDAYDVSRVVTLANETEMELAIRSGGHSLSGLSTLDGGIVLDLSQMKGMTFDLEQRTVWAESGLTAGEYTERSAEYGLVTGFGDTASVGIGGLATGGGIGYLVRKYGLTVDNMLAVEIVTADGEIRHVDAENHPDLFWAIRGGGSNFGVVTRFKFRLYEVDTIIGGMLVLPATPEVIGGFLAEAEAAPEELSTILSVMTAPPMPFLPEAYHGQIVALAMMVYTGEEEDGFRAIAPFRNLAEPIVDMIRPMPYPEIYWPDDPNFRPVTALRSKFIDQIDQDALHATIEHLHASDAMMRIAEFRVLGGAMSRVPVEATAFAHRSRRIMASFITQFENRAEFATHDAWVVAGINELEDRGAVYVNFVGDEGEARVREAYPNQTRERLAKIKAKYDPTNLFNHNQNIVPKFN